MTRLKRSFVLLVIALTVFFNIERLDFGEENIIDISSTTYVVGFLAVISFLLLPRMRQQKRYVALLFWAGLYIIIRLATLFVTHRPLLGGVYTYLTITELALVAVLVALTHDVALDLDDFTEAVRNLTLADISHRVQHFDLAQSDIQRELLRSRRHHSPLSVILCEPDAQSIDVSLNRSVLDVQRSMMSRYVLTNLMRIVSHLLRRTDLIVDQSGSRRFIIVSPDTNAEQAAYLAQRVQTAIKRTVGVAVHCGVSTFPEVAITFDELLDHAETQLCQQIQPFGVDAVPVMEEVASAGDI